MDNLICDKLTGCRPKSPEQLEKERQENDKKRMDFGRGMIKAHPILGLFGIIVMYPWLYFAIPLCCICCSMTCSMMSLLAVSSS